jgi:hypothetical protein
MICCLQQILIIHFAFNRSTVAVLVELYFKMKMARVTAAVITVILQLLRLPWKLAQMLTLYWRSAPELETADHLADDYLATVHRSRFR